MTQICHVEVSAGRQTDEPMRLRPGDSCYFDARAGHAAVSVGIGDALVLIVVTAPGQVSNGEDLSNLDAPNLSVI